MKTQIFGIKNCDTMKKARKWLETNQIEHEFIDYRTDGLTEAQLLEFEAQLGWEALLNKRGTTFRQLSDEQKTTLTKESACALMLTQPAMIKRPLLVHKGQYHLGFKPEQYSVIFS